MSKRAFINLCFMLFVFCKPWWAFASDSVLPEITAYSKLNFSVFRGDVLKVQVEATGEGVSAKWLRSGEVFCREFNCEIDTASWGLGTHKVVFVVFNEHGSLFLRYNIRILTIPPGYKPGPVSPDVVSEQSRVERVAKNDFVVETRIGRGFSSHNRKVQVIGPIARALDWSEKLKTQPGATIDFYSRNREAHSLLSNSSVTLLRGEGMRRAILLRKGTLRVRQLDGQQPEWSVMAGSWLQLDGDEKADFFVRKIEENGDDYLVGAFRGQVRVVVKETVKSKLGMIRDELTLFPGESVLVTRKKKQKLAKKQGSAAVFREIFVASTPFYIPPNLFSDRIAEQNLVLGDKLAEAEANAVVVATESLAQGDFIVALEALNKKIANPKNNIDVLLVAAESFLGLLQIKEAKIYIGDAKLANPKHASPWFLEAVVHIMEKNWPACIIALEEAEDRDFPGVQLLEFYRGRCNLALAKTVAARDAFTYSIWENDNPVVTKASREILATLDLERDLLIAGSVVVGFDSNVFRIAPSNIAMEDVGARESWFSVFRGEARYWPFRSQEGHVAIGLSGERKDFTSQYLKAFFQTDQQLDVEMQINVGGGVKPLLAFTLAGVARVLTLGDKRNHDILESRLAIGSPAFRDIKLYHRNIVNSDPFPLWNDRVDLKRQDVVVSTDRSSKERIIGLTMTPIKDNYSLDLKVESGRSLYKSRESSAENYREILLAIKNSLQFSPRNQGSFDMGALQRNFENERKDSDLNLAVGWRFLWSTSLRHDLVLQYEKRKSTDGDFSFGRQFYSLGLTLEL